FPRGLARKFIPKFLGPLKIVRDFRNNSYEVRLPRDLVQRGVHNVFHASLLRMHVPNDDRLFPGRSWEQVAGADVTGKEWAVKEIRSHSGSNSDAMFEIEWSSGDLTWMPFHEIKHLQALDRYFEALGIEKIDQLP
ncbi:hypothetical protein PLEOSDRAFT_1025619, partial [Pleurotus ostreatus PC15]